MSAARRLAHALAALLGFARGFVGIPAQAAHCSSAHDARTALSDAAARRGRCC